VVSEQLEILAAGDPQVDLEVAVILLFLQILMVLPPDQVHRGKEMLAAQVQAGDLAEMQLVLGVVEPQLAVQDQDLPRQAMAELVIK
jgi:hypothetical protein